jgi:ABC-type lipoprotein release transport system permease subunit
VLLAAGGCLLLIVCATISTATTRRTREIGVRLALGAQRGDVVRLLLAGGVRTTVSGAAAGTLAALAAAGFVESLLFGVSGRDPVTFVGVPVVLASTALVACVVPAWRASRLDPVSVLRAE